MKAARARGVGAARVCFLCGAEGADTKEHVVARAFYEGGKLPNDSRVLVLPSHRACNASVKDDEEHVAHAWAVTAVQPFRSDERYARAVRALQGSCGLRHLVMDRAVHQDNGWVMLSFPGRRVHYVLSKIVRGLLYRETGRVIDQDSMWFIRSATLASMVEAQGKLLDAVIVHAKWQPLHPDLPDAHLVWLSINGDRTFVVNVVPEEFQRHVGAEAVALPWPRQAD